ncbi:MAG: hypothetical protein NDJ89_04905 [Oligoflexia bacterium]|nr:hypothetical protein [Oligoflexia bacterium]
MKTRVGALVFLIHLAWSAQALAGGEIGNARYVPYLNRVGEYETQYPRSWERLDIGSSVSFVEKPATNPSSVNIATQVFSEIRTPEDLRRYIGFFQFDRNWAPIELGGKPGFKSELDGDGAIYLLREEGDLVLIRYNARPGNELSQQDIRVILESLKFSR